MTSSEMNSVKTDIALIKKDINQIENVFKKVDDAIGQMSEILKDIAVQQAVLDNNEKRVSLIEQQLISHHEQELRAREELEREIEEIKSDARKNGQAAREDREKRHAEIMNSINDMQNLLNDKLDKQDKRIQVLEMWRWYIIGAAAVVLALAGLFPWEVLFG